METTAPTYPEYVVQPPQGGYYDSLWDVAERFLGDGQRWREVYDLNHGREQSDGRALTRPELIRPGWRLLLPPNATGLEPALSASQAAAPATQPPPSPRADVPRMAEPTSSPPTTAVRPETWASPDSACAVAINDAPADDADEAASDQEDSVSVPAEAVGGVLAAAAVAALAKMRHRQRRRRPEGAAIPLPGEGLARAEGELRILAEPEDMTFVDEAMRAMTIAIPDDDTPIPDVRMALLRADHLDLVLAEPQQGAPTPFVALQKGDVWRASTVGRPLLDGDQAARVFALFPLLVSVGRDADGTVLLDLEGLGSLAVGGPQADVLDVLSHVVAEVALAPWSDGVEVLLVGFAAELAEELQELAPDRVSAVDQIDAALLRALTMRVGRVAAAGDRLRTRVNASRPAAQDESRSPLLIACAAPPTPELAEALDALVPAEGRGAVAVVAPGPWSSARVTWLLGGPLPVGSGWPTSTPYRFEPSKLRSLAETFRIARSQPDPPMSDVSLPACVELSEDVPAEPGNELDAAVEAYLSETAPAAVTLLGPIAVRATGNIDADRRARLTEIVAYLAAHRGGADVAAFDAALWPVRAVTLQTRNQAITRTRAWLGDDEEGVSWLPPMSDGILMLSPCVLVDWELFRSLQQRATQPGRSAEHVRRDLETALHLVRGRPLSQMPSGRYGWLAETYLEQEIPAAVIDVAHRLAQLLLAEGEAGAALAVARRALEVDRYDERPWRDLLEAHQLRGEFQQVRELVDQLRELLEVELDDELQPETAQLIELLLPRRERV